MKKTFVIGIAGGSASGKSTIATKLEELLYNMQLLVLHMDSYFKPEEELPLVEAPITGKTYRDYNHPSSFYMDRLKAELSEAIESEKYQVIIVEGLLVLWDKDISGMLDLKLFIDCRADERIVRRLKRNMEWGLSFDAISEVYLDLVRYRHDEYVEPSKWHADLILNGSGSTDKALKMILAYVQSANICDMND